MKNFELWLLYAENDLNMAKNNLLSPQVFLVSSIYQAEQCAEKALKAFLVYKAVSFKKTHDLITLVDECAKIDSEFLSLHDYLGELTPYSVDTRYPESHYPDMHTSVAEYSIKEATRVLEFVKEKIYTSSVHPNPEKEMPREY